MTTQQEPVALPVPEPGGPPLAAQDPLAPAGAECHFARILARVAALTGAGLSAPAITRALHSEGFTVASGRSDPISLTAVRRLLSEDIRTPRRGPAATPRAEQAGDEWWLRDLAVELSMPSVTLYGWVRRGWVTVAGREAHAPYRLILRAGHADLERLRARRLTP